MKKFSVINLLIAAVVIQGCAGTSKYEGQGTRALLKDSKALSIGSDKCPRGIGIVRLYKDTLDGNKTRFNAKLALTSKPISGKFNVYNLLDENNSALLQKGERKQASADMDTSNNSIIIKLSKDAVQESQAVNDGTKILKNESGVTVKADEEISIRYNPKNKYYENWGVVDRAVLSAVDADKEGAAILQSASIMLGGQLTKFNIPHTIDIEDDEKSLSKAVSAEIGKPLTLTVSPTDKAGMIYVQFTNGKKGKENATYNYIVDEAPGVAEIAVPTDGMGEGEYVMNVFRSQIKQVDADPKSEGMQAFCMEVGTGIMGRASLSKPDPAAKK